MNYTNYQVDPSVFGPSGGSSTYKQSNYGNTVGTGGNASSSIPIISGIISGASSMFSMGANTPGVGYKINWDKFSKPITYGAPSSIIGTMSGQYAGGGIVSQYVPQKDYTKFGKIANDISGVLGVLGGDTSQIANMMTSESEQQNNLYQDWAAGIGQTLTGKKGIYIKPSKRGSFTAWCKSHGYGGVTSECKSAGRNSKSAAIRKKAVFATNAAKWKH